MTMVVARSTDLTAAIVLLEEEARPREPVFRVVLVSCWVLAGVSIGGVGTARLGSLFGLGVGLPGLPSLAFDRSRFVRG